MAVGGILGGCGSPAGPPTPSGPASGASGAPGTGPGTAAATSTASSAASSPSTTPTPGGTTPGSPSSGGSAAPVDRASTVARFADQRPTQWGTEVTGVVSHTSGGVALTFDCCGGRGGDGFDSALIATLRQRQVPATLLLNLRWIRSHAALAAELAADPLFRIGNHGLTHRPLSVTGRAAYGISGTAGVGEVYDEVMAARDWFVTTTGQPPQWFRSGTAHYDEVAVQICRSVGQQVLGFSLNADAGATLPAAAVAAELARVAPGDIVIGHANHPEGGTAAGVSAALPKLLDRGVKFVHPAVAR